MPRMHAVQLSVLRSFLGAILISATACGAGEGGDTAPAASTPSSVTLDRTSVAIRGVGVTSSVEAAVSDQRGQAIPNPTLAWTTSNASVVTVSGTGAAAQLTSVAPGTATVTARIGSLSAAVSIDVAADVQSITVAPTALSLTIDDQPTSQLTATARADPGVAVTYVWSSSNPQVATVSATGATATVSAVSVGNAVVTVTGRTTFGTSTTATATVIISMAVRSVTLTQRAVDVSIGKTSQLTATVTGETAFPRTVAWSSSNEAVATVSATGLVAGVAAGSARIRATATGDATIRDSIVVTVTALPISLSDFVLIPAGSFEMGSDRIGPRHMVTLTKAFYLQKTELTQAQWTAVMTSNASTFNQCGSSCPVETVSWEEVQIFISQLNALSPGTTYRLPTEAEWEYAARATTTTEAYGTMSDIAWYASNAQGKTHPVAGKQPNVWGLYDMLGNVEEWVQDWHAPYTSAPVVDPTGSASSTSHISRGAAFNYGVGGILPSASLRNLQGVGQRWEAGGFRLVRNP